MSLIDTLDEWMMASFSSFLRLLHCLLLFIRHRFKAIEIRLDPAWPGSVHLSIFRSPAMKWAMHERRSELF